MSKMRNLGIVALCAALTGCAAGGSIDYLHNEHGSAQPDGTVAMGDPDQPQIYKVWLHKSKCKMAVQPPLSAAFSNGFAKRGDLRRR
jgi:hypothetical protein